MNDKSILIVYHSGSGGTQTLSEVLQEKLRQTGTTDMVRVPLDFDHQRLFGYDLLVFGFPTFYCKPSPSISEFVDQMPRFEVPKPAYAFTTLALYAENALRRFAKHLLEKNVVLIGSVEIRAPATDGSLLLPTPLIPFMFSYEKGVHQKIERAVLEITSHLDTPPPRSKIPPPKWYTPFSHLVQTLFLDGFGDNRYNMRILDDRCNNCKRCVETCRRGCWQPGQDRPEFTVENCEFCLGCVHRCPTKAIVYAEGMKDKPRLSPEFHKRLKAETFFS